MAYIELSEQDYDGDEVIVHPNNEAAAVQQVAESESDDEGAKELKVELEEPAALRSKSSRGRRLAAASIR